MYLGIPYLGSFDVYQAPRYLHRKELELYHLGLNAGRMEKAAGFVRSF